MVERGTIQNMEYCRFGTEHKPFIIIPGLAMKSVVRSGEAIRNQYKKMLELRTIYVFDRKKNETPGYTFHDMADDVVEVIKELGIDKADLFGASQGGTICMDIAIRYPEMVDHLIVASTSSRSNSFSDNVFNEWIRLAREDQKEELIGNMLDKVYSKDLLCQYRDYFLKINSDYSEEERQQYLINAEALLNVDLYDDLDKIKAKTLVLGSKNDLVFGEGTSEAIAEKIGCEIYLYDGYGHGVYDEAPDFVDRIIEFIKE